MKSNTSNDLIDLRVLVRRIFSNWYWFALGGLLAYAAAFVYLYISPDTYQVAATIRLIDKEQEALQSDKFLRGIGLLIEDSEKEDEIGILYSHSLIRKTLRQLDFGISYFRKESFRSRQVYHDQPFTIELDSNHVQVAGLEFQVDIINPEKVRIQAKAERASVYDPQKDEITGDVYAFELDQVIRVGKPFVQKNLAFTLRLSENYSSYPDNYAFVIHTLSDLADHFRGKLEIVNTQKESHIIRLSSRSPVAEIEQQFLDHLLQVYIEQELEQNRIKGEQTLSFIDQKLQVVDDTLRKIENSLQQLRDQTGVVDISVSAQGYSDQMNRLETKQSGLLEQQSYYRSLLRSLSSANSLNQVIAPSLMGVNDPLMSDLLIKLSEYHRERAALSQNLKPGHPELEAIEARIQSVQLALRNSVESSLASVEIALSNLNRRMSLIQNNVDQLPRSEKELVKIERRLAFHEDNHRYLSERRMEAGIALANITVNKEVLDPAKVEGPGPIAPNRNLIYLIAMVMGLGIPAGLIMVGDFFNDKIGSAFDIESQTQIPILGYVTRGNKNIRVIRTEHTNSMLAESLRSIRVNLQYLKADMRQKIIGITSSMQGEGKTFCAMNLSVVMALSDKKTLLIDVDLRRPQVAERMGLNNQRGVSSYLQGKYEVDEIIQPTHIENLHVIASGPQYGNPLDLLSTDRMAELIYALEDEYDYIIIDTPPVTLAADYLIISGFVDYTLYIVRHGYTQAESLHRVNELYKSEKLKQVSLIVNDMTASPGTGYGYGYGYGYGMQKNKTESHTQRQLKSQKVSA